MDSKGEARKDPAVFDRDPALFDRVRPDYPAELYTTIQKVSELKRGARLLEIGCGTGKSTTWFAEHGYEVTAVEKGVNLSLFAARKFKNMGNVSVVNSSFESYKGGEAEYDLVYSGTAFHWIDKSIAFTRCAELLNESGHLALFWTDHIITPETRQEIDLVETAYEKVLPEWAEHFKFHGPGGDNEAREREILASGLFEPPRRFDFHFSISYSSTDYISFLSTTSDHGSLAPEVRDALFSEIATVIDKRCNGSYRKDYRLTLFLSGKAV